MKNVFNVDMTNNPDNERIDGAQFITQTLDPVLLQQVDRIADQVQEQEDKAELPLCCAFCAALLVYVRSFASAAL